MARLNAMNFTQRADGLVDPALQRRGAGALYRVRAGVYVCWGFCKFCRLASVFRQFLDAGFYDPGLVQCGCAHLARFVDGVNGLHQVSVSARVVSGIFYRRSHRDGLGRRADLVAC